jgi:hypothetical protein
MKVDKHISELLYDHDCVIVPDFGGFVANYAPAKVHSSQHTFTPPSKNIIFNKNLKNNDGLLANKISSAENTSYPEALKHIERFTASTNSQLKSGQKVTIEEVGTLYLDVERNIQFEQSTTNYLLDAFGLAKFQSPAIKRDTISKRIEKEFKDREPIPAEKKKVPVKRYVALAIAAPLAVGLLWLSFGTNTFKNINYSNLNPFASKEAARYIAQPTASFKELKESDFDSTPLLKASDTSKYVTFQLTDNVSQPITASMVDNKTVGIVKADSLKVSVNRNIDLNADFKFHLVTGCFLIPDNAQRFVTTLQNQNISASIIGKRNGLFVVSAGNYATREEALSQLQQLKQSQPEAWLLVK